MLRNIYILVDRTSVNSISLCLFGCFLIAKKPNWISSYCMCKCFVWCSVCCSTQTRLFLCTCLRHQCQSFAFQHDRPPNVKIPRKKRKEIEMSLGQQKTPLTSELFSTPQKNTTPRPRPPPVLDHQTIHVPFQIFLVQLLHACFSQYYQFPIGHLNLLLPCFNSFCGRAF